MIKHMSAYTNIKTGKTCYHVYYDNGTHSRERRFTEKDNWPMSVVKFFTAEDTIKVEDKVIGNTHYERFAKEAAK